jgi:hypothetical protein
LSDSELSYSKNDFASAQNLSVQCSQLLSDFFSQANEQQDLTTRQRSVDFWSNVVGPIIGGIGVIVAGLIVSRFVTKRHGPGRVDADEQQ